MADTKGGGFIIQKEKDKPKNKCRKWELRVSIGLDPKTGKYKTRSRRFAGTFTQAKVALREFVEEVEGDRVQGRTTYTLEEYCKRYVDRRELTRRSRLQPSTGSASSSRPWPSTSARRSSNRSRLPCSTTCT